MIANVRVLSQQLANPIFDQPKDLTAWMGAIQAQDYNMMKWAVGIRLKSGTIRDVDESLRKGEILRTHVMRPTWHLVPAEDIRWMLKLSAQRIKSVNKTYAKYQQDIPEELYHKCNSLFEKILEGNNHLTKQEIADGLKHEGVDVDEHSLNRFLMNAETDAVICSGIDKGKKPNYALLEERAAPAKELHKEEALAKLALSYFRSHSPASLQDFAWWSGLSLTEARQAIGLIDDVLIRDRFSDQNLFIHQSYSSSAEISDTLHLLPAYDEYLISYKDRTAVLDLEHYPKSFTKFGIFYPVIMYNGIVVGNWKKTLKKGQIVIETSFFEQNFVIREDLLEKAFDRYRAFVSS